MEITLGSTYRDRLTGFEGIASARCEYLTACTQIGLTKLNSAGDGASTVWVDVPMIEEVKGGRVVHASAIPDQPKPSERPGGPRGTPSGPSHP